MRRAAISLILVALTLIMSDRALSEQAEGARDRLCGWYKLTTGNRLIPVFKFDGTYYTVMSRGGFEIPLQQRPDGLEWPRTPPCSMAGTKIGFNEETNEVYISIIDQNREYQDESFTSGKKQPMAAIAKPSWLRDATAQPPRTPDDFLGWYESVWCPYLRGQIRSEGGKYFLEFQLIPTGGEKNSWVRHEQHQLTPLPDKLGFEMQREEDLERDSSMRLIYSTTRTRFELQVSSVGTQSHVSRMPLARIPSPSPKRGAAPLPSTEIGIPVWD